MALSLSVRYCLFVPFADVQRAVEGVAAAASALWHQARTVLFGSQATGLALPGSDLDIVILNVGPHLQRAGSGFSQAQVRARPGSAWA